MFSDLESGFVFISLESGLDRIYDDDYVINPKAYHYNGTVYKGT